MAETAPPKKSIFRIALGSALGLGTGAAAMYFHAAFDQLVKPAKPLANFQVSADGLTVSVENRATGQSGYWDFGDGTALEPFDPSLQVVTHTYPKPGKYDVKLIVRNFLMEETDRSVNVDLTSPSTASNSPKITDFKVQTITDQVPATFRITGKVQNADELIWKLGDRTEHTSMPAEQIDRYVTFDHDGRYPIVLTAFSKSRKDPQVNVESVEVKKTLKDTYDTMVFVTDAGTKTEQRTHMVKLPVPIRDAKGPTKGFNRVLQASPNSVILKAEIDRSMPTVAKNVKCEVAKDQKSATISGEWTASGDAVAKAAGGSDLAVPVILTEEMRTTLSPRRQSLSGVMDAESKITVKLPPRPLGAGIRTVSVDFGLSTRDGKRMKIVQGTLDANGVWQSTPTAIGGQQVRIQAVMKNDTVVMSFISPK